jgi:hypothetical protein
MHRHSISTDNAPPVLGPYNRAIVGNGWCLLLDGVAQQTEQAL